MFKRSAASGGAGACVEVTVNARFVLALWRALDPGRGGAVRNDAAGCQWPVRDESVPPRDDVERKARKVAKKTGAFRGFAGLAAFAFQGRSVSFQRVQATSMD